MHARSNANTTAESLRERTAQAVAYRGESDAPPANFRELMVGSGLEAPFVGRPTAAVPTDAPEGSYEYRLMASGPGVDPSSIEGAADAVEIRICWGGNVVHVEQLAAGRSFFVGEGSAEQPSNFELPSAKLGVAHAPLVLAEKNAAVMVLLPSATGTVKRPGEPAFSLQQAIATGVASPFAAIAGAHQLRLASGTEVNVQLGDIRFFVCGVKSAKRMAAGWSLAALTGGAFAYVLASLLGHVGLLATVASLSPPLGATSDDHVTSEQRYLIQQALDSAAVKELEERDTEVLSDADSASEAGGSGQRSSGAEGSMGDPNETKADGRYAVAGQPDNTDPRVARQRALDEAANFGMVGILNSMSGGDPNAPIAPWGALDSAGVDPISARGNMWGSEPGSAFGASGLGLSGVGESGGGFGEGIGLDSIGTIGHGAGGGLNQGFGPGNGGGWGRPNPTHKTRAPRVRIGPTKVSGRLPSEVIQRIVRQNYGRFRLCYQTGLQTNPNLQGRVSVSFIIGRDGRVSSVGAGGSLPDATVTSCVGSAFYGLSFPQPEGGIVTVRYPIVFAPGS